MTISYFITYPSVNRRPRHSPKRKINEELIKLVMELRKVRNIGIRLLNVNFF